MFFKIIRTSDPYIRFNENPPCKSAIIVEKAKPVTDWIRDEHNKWIEHDTGKTKIEKHWEVEINTLEELLELQTEVEHPLIISSYDLLEIEIYDTYRE